MRIIGWMLTVALVAGATACGGGDEAPAAAVKPAPKTSSATNHAPAIRSVRLEPAAPVDGDRVHAIVTVSDQDGDPLQISYEWQISGRPIASGADWLDLDGLTKRDLIEVIVKASDGKLQSEPARADARIQNRRPNVIGIALDPQPEVLPGDPVVATARANDPDGDSLAYRYRWLVNGKPQMTEGDRFDTQGLVRGDEIQAIVVANDGAADSSELKSVVVRIGNSHPEIDSDPTGNWTDEGFSYEIRAHDPDNDVPLRYALKTGPKGMRVDSVLGKVVWQPTIDQAGVHPVEIAVSDAAGATSVQSFEITVKAEEAAAPPASPSR